MGSQLTPVPSPFVEAPFQRREKGFGERFVDDISDLTLKQGLGLPVTTPLQLGAGAIKGASFGLLDFGDDLKESLGDFALPESTASALDIAGQIGGSFIPFVGASAVAGKVFQGAALGAKLARGATTFGAPEIVRQAVTQEFDPARAVRSVATGAAFSLPLPRLALAPVVAGTELALGADPLEAGAAGLFAGLFGSLGGKSGRNQEIPAIPKSGQLPSGGSRGLLAAGELRGPEGPNSFRVGSNITTPGVASQEENILQGLMAQQGFNAQQLRQAGQPVPVLKPRPTPVSQSELLSQAAGRAGSASEAEALESVSKTVAELGKLPEDRLLLGLNRAIDTVGPDGPEARVMRLALAQKQKGFVPQDAPMKNILPPPVKGVDLVQPGPENPLEVRQMFQDVLGDLRANGGSVGRTKAAQLEEVVAITREKTAAARGLGKELGPAEIKNLVGQQEAILANAEIKFATAAEAKNAATNELAQLTTVSELDGFVSTLPEYYRGIKPELEQAVRNRKSILSEIESEIAPLQRVLSEQPTGFRELMTEGSDAGVSIVLNQSIKQGVAKRIGAVELSHGGQLVKSFKSVDQSRAWLQELEAGAIEPKNIHELRALAFPRGIVADFTGRGTLNITNNLTGETVQNVSSMAEAVRVVRQAPNVAAASREIGPRVAAQPPLPGTGGIGGLATEQPPPFCPLLDDLG